MGGHLFIINGDLTKLACDAVLLPTDESFRIEDAWHDLVNDRSAEIPQSWGTSNVIPLPKRPREPQVWLGKVGQVGDDSDFTSFASVVSEFMANALAQIKLDDEHRIYKWPKLRLAVNVVGSGRGGGSQKKGHLIKGLVENLSSLVDSTEVDIVLVTYGDKRYAAAQRARRNLVGTDSKGIAGVWKFVDETNRELVAIARNLAEDAVDRHLVLFIGAGVSMGAGLPGWGGLLDDVADEAGFDDKEREALKKMDLRDQATLVQRRLTNQGTGLKERVAKKISQVHHFSLLHGLLASLPSNEAITTNFDDLFEKASRVRGRDVAVLPANPRNTGGRLLLKLHGSADCPDNLILTRSDYLNMPRQYGALMGLVQGLLMTRTMVFIGYSLSDEDFHELIDEVRAARGEDSQSRGLVLTLLHDPLQEQLWEDDLRVVPIITREAFDLSEAARELEIFMDLVGYLSTTSAAFFLDDTYSDISDIDSDLRGTLQALARSTAGSAPGSVGQLVARFLGELGAE